jgi:hypothetical protein
MQVDLMVCLEDIVVLALLGIWDISGLHGRNLPLMRGYMHSNSIIILLTKVAIVKVVDSLFVV